MGEIEDDKEKVRKTTEKFWPQLLELLRAKAPELIPMYQTYYHIATTHPNLAVRYRYGAEILKAFTNLNNSTS